MYIYQFSLSVEQDDKQDLRDRAHDHFCYRILRDIYHELVYPDVCKFVPIGHRLAGDTLL